MNHGHRLTVLQLATINGGLADSLDFVGIFHDHVDAD